MSEILTSLSTTQILGGAAVLMLLLNTDLAAVGPYLAKLKPQPKQPGNQMLSLVRELRVESCSCDPGIRNPIAKSLDEIEMALSAPALKTTP